MFKVGDRVKVVRKPASDELRDWCNSWVDFMNPYVDDGVIYTIDIVNNSRAYDAGIKFKREEYKEGHLRYSFPEEALELVRDYTIEKNVTYTVCGQTFATGKEAQEFATRQKLDDLLNKSKLFNKEQADWLFANRGELFNTIGWF